MQYQFSPFEEQDYSKAIDNMNDKNDNFTPRNNESYAYPPAPPNQSPAPKKKERKGKHTALVASLLAVSLCTGMAGGGLSYWMLSGNSSDNDSSYSSSQETGLTPSNTAYNNSSGSNISAIAAKASVSVVEITVESTVSSPFMGEYSSTGSGSGVILSEDGYIVTNDHVVEDAGTITVRTTDGTEYEAVLIGTDSETDLAVIKIEAAGLQAVTFADSDAIEVGELAVAIGNALGTLGGTVTDGIVSAKDRSVTIDGQTMTLLQTSAAVNPGNSGGGLFDSDGNLIGIVNAKSSDAEGLGFAIPSNLVMEVVNEIIEYGYVTGRPQLGISVIEISSEQSARMYRLSELGVYVASVSLDNGLEAGDLIVSIEGQAIENSAQVGVFVTASEVGDLLAFVVKRDGQTMNISAPVSEQIPEYVQQRLAESSNI